MQRASLKNTEKQKNPADWGKISQWKQATDISKSGRKRDSLVNWTTTKCVYQVI